MNRRIIGIGETIMDIIFKHGQPTAAVPGGSVFNSVISLGRLGLNVTFISETGNDRVGRTILDFLKDNGVNNENVCVYFDGRTPISLAWLNDNNDAEYVTTTQLNAANYITAADVPAQVNADWEATSGAAQILNKPTLFDGDYNSLSNKPTIPTVPANVSEFNNDANYVTQTQLNAANYITAADVPAQVNADWEATSGTAQILNKPTLFDGDYNSLSNKPTIPTVPANVSEFNNDAHYVNNATCETIDFCTLVEQLNQLKNVINTLTGVSMSDGQPCPNLPTVKDIDGNTYNTVQIGVQCWMKENLRTTHFTDGNTITYSASTSALTAYRHYPNGNASNVNKFGYLYNFQCADRPGICPVGWHVPTEDEWHTFMYYIISNGGYSCGGSYSNIKKAISSTEEWNTSTAACTPGNTPSSNNATGFSALPAGNYYNNAAHGFKNSGGFWSSSFASSNNNAIYFNLTTADTSYDNYSYGYSIRCLKD